MTHRPWSIPAGAGCELKRNVALIQCTIDPRVCGASASTCATRTPRATTLRTAWAVQEGGRARSGAEAASTSGTLRGSDRGCVRGCGLYWNRYRSMPFATMVRMMIRRSKLIRIGFPFCNAASKNPVPPALGITTWWYRAASPTQRLAQVICASHYHMIIRLQSDARSRKQGTITARPQQRAK